MYEQMDVDLAEALRKEALAGGLREVCGFVMRGWNYIPIENVNPDPEREFTMHPDQMVHVMSRDFNNILGVYHSHPRGHYRPSDTDIYGMRYPEFRYWIVTHKDVYEWRIENDISKPVRRDGSTGLFDDMAYPILAPAEALRRAGGCTPSHSDEEGRD